MYTPLDLDLISTLGRKKIVEVFSDESYITQNDHPHLEDLFRWAEEKKIEIEIYDN